jgi:hypothetical protein
MQTQSVGFGLRMQTLVLRRAGIPEKKSIDGFPQFWKVALRKYASPAVLSDVSFPSLSRQEPSRFFQFSFHFSAASSWRVTASSP